jgi:hypothetical protein
MQKNRQKISADRIKQAVSKVNLNRPDTMVAIAPLDIWQIVVVGNIDPRQHFPHWYRLIESITDEELATALKMLTAVAVPGPMDARMPKQVFLLHFVVGYFDILVTQDRLLVHTANENNCNRMLDVASNVFKRLNEISIVAYGINRELSLKMDKMTAKTFLANTLSSSDLALPKGPAEGQIIYALHLGSTDTLITLVPFPPAGQWLHIVYNCQHNISRPSNSLPTYFDLGQLIRDNANSDWKSATQYGSDLAGCVRRAQGE